MNTSASAARPVPPRPPGRPSSSMSFPTGLFVWRLNRPEVRNAIDQDMVAALHGAHATAEGNPKFVLLVGEGSTFAASADIAQLCERRGEDALRGITSGIFDRIQRLPMSAIALIDGHAWAAVPSSRTPRPPVRGHRKHDDGADSGGSGYQRPRCSGTSRTSGSDPISVAAKSRKI